MTLSSTAGAPADLTAATGRPRRIALRTLAVLYALFTALASFGLPSLLTAWTTSGEELALRTQYVIWGLLAGVLLPVLAVALVRRPLVAPAQALAAFVLATILALPFAFEPENLEYASYFAVPALVIALVHPAGRALLTAGTWHRPTLGLAAVAAVPTVLWAVDNLRKSAALPYTDTQHGQYFQAGLLGFALLAATVVAARRASGWQWVAGAVAFCAVTLGVAGLVFPGDDSSVGTAGGALAVALGLLLAMTSSRD